MSAFKKVLCVFPFLVVLAAHSFAHAAERPRGDLLELHLLRSFARDDIDRAMSKNLAALGAARCDVKVYELRYVTIGVRDEPANASALLLLPDGEQCQEAHPLLGWGRATETRRAITQASQAAAAANYPLTSIYAAQGYAVVASDYLGLGKSTYPFHPYLHADSQAHSIIDSLRAARLATTRLNVALRPQVLLAGYSQGGHSAMAAQREIESHEGDEFKLLASAPMSGPYALSQTFLEHWSGEGAAANNPFLTSLFAYTLVGMQGVYGNVFEHPAQVFLPPYADKVKSWLPGRYSIFDLQKGGRLPIGIAQLRQPAFAAPLAGTPLLADLEANDLLDWTPRTPMLLCGAATDPVVDFQNTRTAQAVFQTRGVKVPVLDVAGQIPANVSGGVIHTGWASQLCMLQVRQRLFDPALKQAAP